MKNNVNQQNGPFSTFLESAGTIHSRFKRKYNWVEESFVFDKSVGKQVTIPHSNDYTHSSLEGKRIKFLFVFFTLLFIIILARLLNIQIIEGQHYVALATNNRERIIPIPAERGLIYDRHNVQLTQNIPNFALALTPQDLPRQEEERNRIVEELAHITGESTETLAALIKQYGSYSYESIVIKENLDYETALLLQMQSSGLPGISIQRGSKRLYTFPATIDTPTSTAHSASHLLGYLGKLSKEELEERYAQGYLPSDSLGKSGLEKIYETLLRGTYGKKRVEVDSRGKEQSTLAEEAPTPGKHLVLSIDIEMQEQLQTILEGHMEKVGLTKAAAIATDPYSGEILALVSLPAFANNDFSGGISAARYAQYNENPDHPLFNRAISGTYPSGSTIKPVIAAAALQEQVVSANNSFLSVGGIRIGQWFFPDWQAGGHGITNLRKSIADSVNTYYYIIGGGYNTTQGLGVERIKQYLEKFHFGQAMGIDLPNEANGFVPSPAWKEQVKNEQWYIGDTYNLSIGQGDLLVTPLQIAMMTASFANGGTIYKPHLLQKVINPVSKEEQTIAPEIVQKNMVSAEHIASVRWGMRDCVTNGSCRRLSLLPFSSAGKTGTAQWSNNKEPHAWFTSFAPFERPQITLTVLVEEGEGGSVIAAPIAYDFYRWWGEYRYRQ